MRVQIYIYKRYDMDLLALAAAGYPVTAMIKNAVLAYSKSMPLFYFIDEYIPVNVNEIKIMKITFRIGQKETAAIKMLENITPSKKSAFCKTLLRNALVGQNLNCFFIKGKNFDLYKDYTGHFPVNNYENVVKLSSIRQEKTFSFLDKVFIKNPKPITVEMDTDTKMDGVPKRRNKKIENEGKNIRLDRKTDDVNANNTGSPDAGAAPIMAYDNKLFSIFDNF